MHIVSDCMQTTFEHRKKIQSTSTMFLETIWKFIIKIMFSIVSLFWRIILFLAHLSYSDQTLSSFVEKLVWLRLLINHWYGNIIIGPPQNFASSQNNSPRWVPRPSASLIDVLFMTVLPYRQPGSGDWPQCRNPIASCLWLHHRNGCNMEKTPQEKTKVQRERLWSIRSVWVSMNEISTWILWKMSKQNIVMEVSKCRVQAYLESKIFMLQFPEGNVLVPCWWLNVHGNYFHYTTCSYSMKESPSFSTLLYNGNSL